jgi:hypothetical protein
MLIHRKMMILYVDCTKLGGSGQVKMIPILKTHMMIQIHLMMMSLTMNRGRALMKMKMILKMMVMMKVRVNRPQVTKKEISRVTNL